MAKSAVKKSAPAQKKKSPQLYIVKTKREYGGYRYHIFNKRPGGDHLKFDTRTGQLVAENEIDTGEAVTNFCDAFGNITMANLEVGVPYRLDLAFTKDIPDAAATVKVLEKALAKAKVKVKSAPVAAAAAAAK
jgi:hypothetical protein